MSSVRCTEERTCPECNSDDMLFVAVSRVSGQKICFECKSREDKRMQVSK